MSQTLERVRQLLAKGDVRVSDHGYDELSNDALTVQEILNGITAGKAIEDYPNYAKGPCTLVLQTDAKGDSRGSVD